MFKYFIFLLFFITVNDILAQQEIDTVKIQRKAKHISRRFTKSPDVLAQHLTRKYSDEASKVIAMTYWISKNIRYNYKAFVNREVYGKSTVEVLKKRKALCGEYATLYNEMCESVGISSETVSGYTKDYDLSEIDTLFRAEHAWNVTKINGNWTLLDLTWGSGFIKQRKQYIARILFLLFSKPFEVQFKFKKRYNPDWFYVDPNRMILSHFPTLDFFQLKTRVSTIDQFVKGTSIDSKNVNFSPTLLNRFSSKTNYEQWLYTAKYGNLNNPRNNRISGFNYLLLTDSLFNKYASRKDKILNTNHHQLDEIANYNNLADSLLSLSILDNNREYKIYEERNGMWKSKLQYNNKLFLKHIKDIKKDNLARKKTILITKRLIKAERKRNKISVRKINKTKIEIVKRPKKDNLSKHRKVTRLFLVVDSLKLVSFDYLKSKDSLFTVVPKIKIDEALANEKRNLLTSQIIYSNLKSFVNYKKWNSYQEVYYYKDSLNKPFFKEALNGIYLKNGNSNKPISTTLLSNFKKIKKEIRLYTKCVESQLRAVKKIKKNSLMDFSEDSLFNNIKKGYKNQIELYENQLSNYGYKQKDIITFWRLINQSLYKSSRQLKKDSSIENFRYGTYKRYRKRIQKAENNRMTQFRKELKRINRYIQNTFEMEEELQK